jgi:serine/threonine protein kinase
MKREAQAMAKVSHPNVVQVYEVGTRNGQLFVAMEFVKGKTLSEWLARVAEERTWEEILEMYLQAGRGLAAAHRQGLVHRDFKPDNVLVDGDGRARVLDFGLARAEGMRTHDADSALQRSCASPHAGNVLSTNLTMAGAIMGTPAFMSPEQHLGRATDARSDQFSFCVALYGGALQPGPVRRHHPGRAERERHDGRAAPAARGHQRARLGVRRRCRPASPPTPTDRYPSMDTLLAALSPEVRRPRRRWAWPAALVGRLGARRPDHPRARRRRRRRGPRTSRRSLA